MKYFSNIFIVGAAFISCAASAEVNLSTSPFGIVDIAAAEATELEMPKLEFVVTPEDERNFDKYYYFRRDETSFPVAYADITECDGYARGLVSRYSYEDGFYAYPYTYPYDYSYTVAGAAGSAIANVMIAAIFVPSEKRWMRRVNMRQCMGFKGYDRIGLSKALWEPFNFEEGTGAEEEESRLKALKLQALVASTAAASEKVLSR
ncbi:MAG: hypothetical protein JHC92_04180 [Sphingomonadaceae bacterium]|nr:hypothetical protein [Sphingomonadaceae bacterium]